MTKVIFEKSNIGVSGISLTDEEINVDFISEKHLRKSDAILPQVSELEIVQAFSIQPK